MPVGLASVVASEQYWHLLQLPLDVLYDIIRMSWPCSGFVSILYNVEGSFLHDVDILGCGIPCFAHAAPPPFDYLV